MGVNSTDTNLHSPGEPIPHLANFYVFFYMFVLMLISNMATSILRKYRRSLPLLRINQVLLLNGYLVEIFNTCFTYMCFVTMWCSGVSYLPYWMGVISSSVVYFLMNVSLLISMSISLVRTLLVVKFNMMIQLDPELWAKRILFFILAFLAIVVGVQAFQCYSVGYVSPQESFYTGLEVSDQMNPHIITILGIGSVAFLTTVGSYTFNWYYLKTYHNTRNSILRTIVEAEQLNSVKNMISNKSLTATAFFSLLAVVLVTSMRR
ncbi:uncharacterized protein LOC111708703 [Eurytemora carolleeae]|uniref:uncharacterized protein LOC111708703 n=1 Tax=Eurytemora carolleeae TaxID=1294199 RepID=UPI000C75AD28|nr:uncharacterized protein LOC111708703 [Eurytemora carolleeae]|eukprot:XP_023337930.1 uncharacterized protein LOC111708703 [Eurytemora affinis]